MDSGIIISLILGFASIVSSICFGLIPGIRREKLDRMEKKVHTLAQDVDFFLAIEKSLLEQLSSVTGKNKDTLKKEIRKQVSSEKNRMLSHYSKPSGIGPQLL